MLCAVQRYRTELQERRILYGFYTSIEHLRNVRLFHVMLRADTEKHRIVR